MFYSFLQSSYWDKYEDLKHKKKWNHGGPKNHFQINIFMKIILRGL